MEFSEVTHDIEWSPEYLHARSRELVRVWLQHGGERDIMTEVTTDAELHPGNNGNLDHRQTPDVFVDD